MAAHSQLRFIRTNNLRPEARMEFLFSQVAR